METELPAGSAGRLVELYAFALGARHAVNAAELEARRLWTAYEAEVEAVKAAFGLEGDYLIDLKRGVLTPAPQSAEPGGA